MGHGHQGARPQGPRPAVCPRRQRPADDGVRAADPVPPGPGRDDPLVRRAPSLVGAAQTARCRARVRRSRSRLGPGPGRIRADAVTGWLVTGAGGMLGTDLVAALTARDEPVTGLDRAELDITDAAAVTDAIAAARPDVVVNCAAWTAVDDAEAAEEQALVVNGRGPANVAAACARTGARLVQVSTDYVF